MFIKKLSLITIAAVALSFSNSSFAEDSVSTEVGKIDEKRQTLTPEDLRSRFELHGSIFVTDGSGKIISPGYEARKWMFGGKGKIVSNWSFAALDIKEIALVHTWEVTSDGRIWGQIKQFDTLSRAKEHSAKIVTGKLIREEKVEIKDFAPINWVAYSSPTERIIVRFSPQITEKSQLIDITALPLSLNNVVIFDGKGNLWASRGTGIEGKFIGLRTHFGEIVLSYSPFKGATELGSVLGSEITLNMDAKNKLYLRSEKPILASSAPAKLYGIINKSKKTSHIHSIYSFSNGVESDFLKQMNQ